MLPILIQILLVFIGEGSIPCSEENYDNIILEPTHPYSREPFIMDSKDYKNLDDVNGFGIWTQYLPY